jgi:hypothetical protein
MRMKRVFIGRLTPAPKGAQFGSLNRSGKPLRSERNAKIAVTTLCKVCARLTSRVVASGRVPRLPTPGKHGAPKMENCARLEN